MLGFAFLNTIRVAAFSVLGPAIADETFGREGWGLVLAVQTGGMVAGTLIALAIRPRHLLRFGVICMLGQLPVMFALAKMPLLLVLLPLAMLAGTAAVQFSISWETTMQRYIPAEKLARVYSYDMLGSILVVPLGQVAAGPLAAAFDVGPTLLAGVAISFVVIIGMLASRSVRTLPTDPPKQEGTIPEPKPDKPKVPAST